MTALLATVLVVAVVSMAVLFRVKPILFIAGVTIV